MTVRLKTECGEEGRCRYSNWYKLLALCPVPIFRLVWCWTLQVGVNKILQLQSVILPTDSNCMVSLGMHKTEDKIVYPMIRSGRDVTRLGGCKGCTISSVYTSGIRNGRTMCKDRMIKSHMMSDTWVKYLGSRISRGSRHSSEIRSRRRSTDTKSLSKIWGNLWELIRW